MLEGGAGRDSFVFGARGGNDIVRDFDVASDKLLFDGTAIRSTQVADWNGDGTADIRLALTAGGSVTLLGLSSLAGVQTGNFSEAQAQQQALRSEMEVSIVRQDLLHADMWLVA
jgi:Ca2+-binding RTX toxin-like protein